jgi:hypothetical protein
MRHEPSLALHAQVCLVCGLRTRSSSEFAPWCLSSHPIDYICRKPLTSNPAPPCPLSYANSAPSTTLISFSLVYHQFFLRCRTFLLALDVIYFYVTCTSFTTLRSLYFWRPNFYPNRTVQPQDARVQIWMVHARVMRVCLPNDLNEQ